MKIALDYDGTFTRDPAFWMQFIHNAKAQGHEVKILTMRFKSEPIEHAIPCDIIYTGRKAKRAFFRDADIFIDDQPEFLLMDAA